MPNYCDYEAKIKGKKDNVLKLAEWLEANYEYGEYDKETNQYVKHNVPSVYVVRNNKKVPTEHHVGYRVFECNYDIHSLDDKSSDDVVVLDCSGYVAWSLKSCLFDGPSTYLEEFKDNKKSLSISLPNACKKLNVEIELVSSEPGMSFSERYYINSSGEIVEDDCVEYVEYYLEEYQTFEEMQSYFKDNELKLEITNEQFDDAKSYFDDYLRICSHIDKCGNYIFTYIN